MDKIEANARSTFLSKNIPELQRLRQDANASIAGKRVKIRWKSGVVLRLAQRPKTLCAREPQPLRELAVTRASIADTRKALFDGPLGDLSWSKRPIPTSIRHSGKENGSRSLNI